MINAPGTIDSIFVSAGCAIVSFEGRSERAPIYADADLPDMDGVIEKTSLVGVIEFN